MERVEGEVDLVAGEGGGKEAATVLGDHVELQTRGLSDRPDNRIVACCAEAESAAGGEMKGELADFEKLGREGEVGG